MLTPGLAGAAWLGAGLIWLGLIAGQVAAACVPAEFTIALDVGHDRESHGAVSARGVPEFAFNDALAKRLFAGLRAAGFTSSVRLNPSGEPMPLRARGALAASAGAALLISIHHDSVQPRYLAEWTFAGRRVRYSDRFSGFSLFYSEKNPQAAQSLHLARLLGEELVAAGLAPSDHHAEPIPGEGRELALPEHGVYRFDDLVVLKSAPMPAVLLEAGIIVNRLDELALQSPAFQERLVAAAVRAVQRYCVAARG